MTRPLPPAQQLVAAERWPVVGERAPASVPGRWTVEVAGAANRPQTWTLEELRNMKMLSRTIDIHCVTRWSKLDVPFTGIMLSHLLSAAEPTEEARFVSFVAHSARGHSTSLPLKEAVDLEVMVAFAANGVDLPVEHGGPVRMVVPGRYFYKSVKWLHRIELLPEDRLGYWEAEAGYHNAADPWREQRYVAEGITKQLASELISAKDLSNRSLLSISASGRELRHLQAIDAVLRNADFRNCDLRDACFDGANLSNARFASADLRNASFISADVEGADFSGADLSGTDMRGASLFGASFFDEEAKQYASFDDATQIDPEAFSQLVDSQASLLRLLLRNQEH